MRLTAEQILTITQTISRLTSGKAEVYLFGSRTDDRSRGGDVDLLIETPERLSFIDRARIRMELEISVGLPFDLLFHALPSAPTSFQRIAAKSAVRLVTP